MVVVEEVPDLAVASLNEGCRLMLDEEEVVVVVLVVEARADCGIAADEGLSGASCLVYLLHVSAAPLCPRSGSGWDVPLLVE